MSAIPGSHVPQFTTLAGADKIEHALLYGLLGLLLARGIMLLRPATGPLVCVLLVAYLALFYATTDEVHQLFTPGRSCDPFDAAADLAGGTLGALLFVLTRGWGRLSGMVVPVAASAEKEAP